MKKVNDGKQKWENMDVDIVMLGEHVFCQVRDTCATALWLFTKQDFLNSLV